MATDMLQYLDPDGLNETVLNIGQIKTILEGQISDLGESIEEEMQDLPYARPDGLYPDMTVGAVQGAPQTSQWATRESTGSGAATVRSVQGASVVWNQLNNNALYTGTTSGVTFTNNGDGSWTLSGTATASANKILNVISCPADHKLLLKGCVGGSANTYYMGIGGTITDAGSGGIVTSGATNNLRIDFKNGVDFGDGVTIWPQVFDLTAMFGSGNEPTTVAEFEAMYPEAYYPYSEPTLKPVQIAGIASTDANGDALDSVEWETYTLRAAGSVRDELTADELVTRVGQVTLDNNFTVAYTQAYTGRTNANVIITDWDGKSNGDITSDQFVLTTGGWASVNLGQVMLYTTGMFLGLPDTVTNNSEATSWLNEHKPTFNYELATPTTQPISPALPMTYRVEQGGTESIIVPDGEISAAPVLTVAEPVNMSTELARIWAAIESLGYTRNTAQLSRPISLTDAGSIDETQKDTTDVADIDTTKEVQE